MEIKNSIDNEIEVISTHLNKTGTDSISQQNKYDKATYDLSKSTHVYSNILDEDSSGELILTKEKINNLALNPQNDLKKIQDINQYIMYYMNKDDLTGKIVETLENNTNVNYTLVYPTAPKTIEKKVKLLINDFINSVDLDLFIPNAVSTSFYEGNFLCYLRETKDNYKIVKYPLGLVEVTPFMNDGEPVLVMDMNDLKKRLSKNSGKYKNKNKSLLFDTVEGEVKKNYPKEVNDSFRQKDKYAKLNPERTGIVRVNNYNRMYGVSPIFKSLSAQVMLDSIDITDSKNTVAKGKKFIVQILRKEIAGLDGKQDHFEEQSYAHRTVLEALKHDLVVVTSPGYVEDIKILEPKQEPTNIATINHYRNKVLNALGITFLSNEAKSSFNAVEVSVKELMKTIDKIIKQVEKIINKYFQVVLKENKIDLMYCPKIQIDSSKMLEEDLKLSIVDTMFNKLGCSYQTAYEILDRDFDTELRRRQDENDFVGDKDSEEKGADKIFYPRVNAFTVSGKDKDLRDNKNNNFDKKSENQNTDKSKKNYDKEKYKEKV